MHPEKLYIVGPVAAGKTVMAGRLSKRFNIPRFELDNLYQQRLAEGDIRRSAEDRDARFKKIPVVMLTVSKRDEDIVMSYEQGCNSFIQKPVKFESFVEIVKQIGVYWGAINVEFPDEPGV